MKDKLVQWLTNPRLVRTYLPYLGLTLLVMAPLLLPGYVLTLDMVFVPHPPLPAELSSSYVFHTLLHFLSYVIPSDVLQKVILGAIIFLSAYGAHRLIERVRPSKTDQIWQWMPYFAGLLYTFNPFVYERFMAGQYSVLMGYALVPWFVRSLLQLLQNPSFRTSLSIVLWTIAISILSIHTIGVLVIVALVAMSLTLWKRRTNIERLIQTLKYCLLIAGGVIALSSYWLVPTLLGHGPIADAGEFNATHFSAFATQGGLFGVMQLHGFWAENAGLFIPHDDPLPLSGIWQLLLWALTITGIITSWRRQRALSIIFLGSALIASLLALGLFQVWLVKYIPLFAGYREPQKFVMLIALGNVYFGSWGAAAIAHQVAKRRGLQRTVLVTAVLLPILITPTMLWGFYGQLYAHNYPKDWYTMADYLANQKAEGKVLFLPWHLYMRFSFAGGRLLANPGDQFFLGKTVIVSDDPEFGGITPQSPDPTKAKLSQLLKHDPQHHLDVQQLTHLGIRYILLAREGDADDYEYIAKIKGVQATKDLPTLKLYEVHP